jgi:hypothetical protein
VRSDLLEISYRVTSRDPRLPNGQAAHEKIEARFFSWSITSGLPVIWAQSQMAA